MKIAFLSSRFPYPLEKGDKLRLFHQMRDLAKRGHQIGLFSLYDSAVSAEQLNRLAEFCDPVEIFPLSGWGHFMGLARALFQPLPFQCGFFLKPGMKTAIFQKLRDFQPDHLVCQLIRMSEYARDWPGPKTLDYMDAFSFIFQKRMEEASPLIRPILRLETNRLAKYEAEVFSAFDNHLVISERDREMLPVLDSDYITIVPNGIDVDFFAPRRSKMPDYDLVFVGNLGYHPNVEAVRWFVRKVWPRLRQARPRIKMLVAGARPVATIRRLADAHLTVSGWIPDIRDAYANGKIFVAPLFHGGGQQNKLLEAMAMGLPCVTTTRVNASLGALDSQSLYEAETADAFVETILHLLDHPAVARRVGEAARAFVRERFTWEKSVAILEEVLLRGR